MEFSRQEYWSGLPLHSIISLKTSKASSPAFFAKTALAILGPLNCHKNFRISSSSFTVRISWDFHCFGLAPQLAAAAAAAAAKSLQSCLTLCNPIDGSPRGSSVAGILQARILEWVAISFSNA